MRKRVGNICRALKKCYSKAKHASVYKKIDSRAIKFEEFKKKYICQSRNVYTKNDLDKLPQEYKLFITGSDQVWHPNAVCDAYLLAFGNSEVKSMSYAASVAKDTLTEAELERYSLSFRNYSAISVREKNAVEILQPASPIKIQWVLDTVFLLGRKKWDSLGGDKKIKKKYVFCYFLGESNAQRKVAYEYAQRRECDMFLIGHLNNEYMECDEKIRGENIVDADPLDFVRLIRDAETVFTDSFHARNTCLRPSCYKCPSKGVKRSSDITLADFWNVSDFIADFDDNKGVDLIVCHSEKGRDLLRTVNESVVYQEVSVRAATENIPMNNSPHLPKNRQEFIASLNTGSFSDSVDKYCSIPFSERVHTKIKLIIKKISRRK